MISNFNRAGAIFERLIGRKLTITTYIERLENRPLSGLQINHTPLQQIITIRARTSNWGMDFDYGKVFGKTGWIGIDPEDVVVHTKDDKVAISLPPSIFGTPYDEAEITYKAGLLEMPQDVREAVIKMSQLLENHELDEWNCILPSDVIDVVSKYKKGVL